MLYVWFGRLWNVWYIEKNTSYAANCLNNVDYNVVSTVGNAFSCYLFHSEIVIKCNHSQWEIWHVFLLLFTAQFSSLHFSCKTVNDSKETQTYYNVYINIQCYNVNCGKRCKRSMQCDFFIVPTITPCCCSKYFCSPFHSICNYLVTVIILYKSLSFFLSQGHVPNAWRITCLVTQFLLLVEAASLCWSYSLAIER